VKKLTGKPVIAVATHIHWDHIGGHKYYPEFYAHEAELNWLNGGFPLSMDTIRGMVIDRCDLPECYDVSTYKLFQGIPTRVLHDGDTIDLGGRVITALHTPGHCLGIYVFGNHNVDTYLPAILSTRIRCLRTTLPPTRRHISLRLKKLRYYP
jgi:glyoxylase-like metal-dependent hydrolase (beta-lactamase superfamily II)